MEKTEKVRIEELSVGDLVKWQVYDKTYDVRITQITDTLVRGVYDGIEYGMLSKQISPIPLTPEILEKNGKTNKDYLAWLIAGRAVVEKEQKGDYSVHIYDASIDKVLVTACAQHVHQLQHALRLAGIKKEIEL